MGKLPQYLRDQTLLFLAWVTSLTQDYRHLAWGGTHCFLHPANLQFSLLPHFIFRLPLENKLSSGSVASIFIYLAFTKLQLRMAKNATRVCKWQYKKNILRRLDDIILTHPCKVLLCFQYFKVCVKLIFLRTLVLMLMMVKMDCQPFSGLRCKCLL